MNSLFYYIVQVIICSGILYGYYHVALRNKKFHRYNRYYLLMATVLPIIIPFFNIPVYFAVSAERSSGILQTLANISPDHAGGHASVFLSSASHISIFTLENISAVFYLIVISFIFIRFLIAILYIKKLIHKYVVERIHHIYFINTDEPGTPFSFFKWLFWNKKIELKTEKGQQIFRHELFHIQQNHSRDIIFIEISTAIFWINPFFHLLKKELKAVHEFLADEFATKEKDKWNYAELLLMQVLDSPCNNLANPFFHNQIKRRIAMITSSNKPKYQFLRKLMILPVITFVFVLFAFKIKSNSEKTTKESDEGITVITNGMRTGVQTFFQERDTSKPTIKKKQKQQPLKKIPQETEKTQQEFEQLMAEKQKEAEKSQQEFKELMEAKQREVENAEEEFKQLMAEKQKEAEKTQEEFKEMMEAQRREADKKQEEFKKMMEQHQVDPKEQEKFKLLMAEKQKEAEKTQEEFKLLMMRKQKEAEKSQEEFKQLMMLKQQEAEKTQKEFKQMMEAKQREAEKEQEEFKKKVLLKQQESEKNKKETEKIHNEKNKE